MTEVTAFEIDREKWLVGRTAYEHSLEECSFLATPEKRACCLGIYLQSSCGMDHQDLVGQQTPAQVVPPYFQWLTVAGLDGDSQNSNATYDLMHYNDDPSLSFEEREGHVRRKFARQNVKVTFTGDYPEWVKERLSHA